MTFARRPHRVATNSFCRPRCWQRRKAGLTTAHALQMIYATATWTWRKRIREIELFNEPELEACWTSAIFVQQSALRRGAMPSLALCLRWASDVSHVNLD